MHPLPSFTLLLTFVLAAVALAAGLDGLTAAERRFPQAETPPFWKGRLEDVAAAVKAVRRGKRGVIARSPGRRPVYLVTYGPPVPLQRQANYNSAAGAGDPGFYSRKAEGAPPTVLLIGPPHGQEVEGIVGLVNLLRIAETGEDWRGRGRRALARAAASDSAGGRAPGAGTGRSGAGRG